MTWPNASCPRARSLNHAYTNLDTVTSHLIEREADVDAVNARPYDEAARIAAMVAPYHPPAALMLGDHGAAAAQRDERRRAASLQEGSANSVLQGRIGFLHDVIGTRCDPCMLKGTKYHHCCHSNLTRALATERNLPLEAQPNTSKSAISGRHLRQSTSAGTTGNGALQPVADHAADGRRCPKQTLSFTTTTGPADNKRPLVVTYSRPGTRSGTQIPCRPYRAGDNLRTQTRRRK